MYTNRSHIHGAGPENAQFSQTLLWIQQEEWQQNLMVRYGNTMSLIDATYKTTKYDLPLFFVTVRTNVGYKVVAHFIVQSETTEQILEALNILKSWNKDWKPAFFLCDYSEAEISAIEQAFHEITVYICDFHREQAWTRWTRDHKNGLNKGEQEQLLANLRACAWAPSPPPDSGLSQDVYYQQAVTALKKSPECMAKPHQCTASLEPRPLPAFQCCTLKNGKAWYLKSRGVEPW